MVESQIGKGSPFTINLPWDKNGITQQELLEAGGKFSTLQELKIP